MSARDDHDEMSETTSTCSYTPEQLGEFLELWRRPEGVLTPDQLRALIAWSGTPDEERDAVRSELNSRQQEAKAKPLAPNQRRGHVSLLERARAFLSR